MSAKEKSGENAGAVRGEAAKAARETRCYTLTGAARELDAAERMLQQMEQAGESEEAGLLLFVLEGGQRGVRLRTLATWEEEEETIDVRQ